LYNIEVAKKRKNQKININIKKYGFNFIKCFVYGIILTAYGNQHAQKT